MACGAKPHAWLRSIVKGGDDVRTMDDATFERLRDEWRALMRRFARMGHESPYARAGISPLGTEVLIAIGALERAAEVARPSVVAKRVGTTPSSLSQALKSLEEKGLLERRRLAGDSRGVALALTEAGRGLARCGLGGRDARLRALFDHLGAEDVAEFMRVARTSSHRMPRRRVGWLLLAARPWSRARRCPKTTRRRLRLSARRT